MRKEDYAFGFFLVFIGVLFLLLNLNVLNFEWLLFILSIGLIVEYFIKDHLGYLISGLVLLAISLIYILNEYAFPGVNIKGFLFLWIFGIISMVLYGRQKSKGLLIFGTILPALGTYNLIEELSSGNVSWTLYLLFGIAFFIIYLMLIYKPLIWTFVTSKYCSQAAVQVEDLFRRSFPEDQFQYFC